MPSRKREAHAGSPAHACNSSLPAPLKPLSPREEEVLEWIAQGKRNGDIGRILKLSHRTVEKHVQNLMAKLGVETRSAGGAWWHERRHLSELAQLAQHRKAAL